jgi:DNA primase
MHILYRSIRKMASSLGLDGRSREGDTISKKGSQAGLFNVECLKAASYGVIIYICEGEWDAMALEAQGYEYVVGVPGAFTFMKEWLHLFKDRHVVILYDADQTGAIAVQSSCKNADWFRFKRKEWSIYQRFCHVGRCEGFFQWEQIKN